MNSAGLVKPKTDVHALHSLTRRALHEIVDRAFNDQMRAFERKADVAEVRARYGRDAWPSTRGKHSHERTVGVGVLEHAAHRVFSRACMQLDMNRRENAAVKAAQVRRKDRRNARVFTDLWTMTMLEHAVGLHAHFAEEALHFGLASRA